LSTSKNKAQVRRWVEEVVNQKDHAARDDIFSPDFIDYTNPPDWTPGREGHKQIIALYHTAFPDFHFTVEHEIAEGDMVVIRGTYHFTHEGEFFGIAPTGKLVTSTGTHLFRLAEWKMIGTLVQQ